MATNQRRPRTQAAGPLATTSIQQQPATTTFGAYNPQAGFQRDATLAQNAYSRFLSQQRGARQLADIDRSQTRGIERFASSYGQRGLLNSGIYQQAQNDYASNWMNQQQSVLERIYDELRQASMSDAQAWNTFNADVASTAGDKTQEILATALALKDLKSFMGGA